jgi:hypothetical protein
LKLRFLRFLSTFAFNFNLRRYMKEFPALPAVNPEWPAAAAAALPPAPPGAAPGSAVDWDAVIKRAVEAGSAVPEVAWAAGTDTRPLFSST